MTPPAPIIDHRAFRLRGLPIPQLQELKPDDGIHEQDPRGAEEEWRRADDPLHPVIPLRSRPAVKAVGRGVSPGEGAGEERSAVEQVAEEGGDEQGRR